MFFPPNTGYCKYIYLYFFFSLRFKSKQTKIWGQVQYDKNDAIKRKCLAIYLLPSGLPFHSG